MDEENNNQNETASPAGNATVEEIHETAAGQREPLEGEEPITPRGEGDVAYRLGRLETELVQYRRQNESLRAQLAAFEEATIAAVEAEAEALAEQEAVVSLVAEEVLSDDDQAAQALNPDHGQRQPKWWEQVMCGSKGRT